MLILRGHPGVQKHCRATWTILILQMCYSGTRKLLVSILKATKGVHHQRYKYTTQTPGCPLNIGSKGHNYTYTVEPWNVNQSSYNYTTASPYFYNSTNFPSYSSQSYYNFTTAPPSYSNYTSGYPWWNSNNSTMKPSYSTTGAPWNNTIFPW